MAGLRRDIYKQCRETFLKCEEFGNHDSLLTVFVTTELYPFRDGLPNANSRRGLVDTCLDYLLSQQTSDGRSLLLLFLDALCSKYGPGDNRRVELEKLHSAVAMDQGQPNAIDIPFIVLAMTSDEASALVNGTAFESTAIAENDRIRFQQFKEALDEQGILDWLSCYKESRESWVPQTCCPKPVDESCLQSPIREIVFGIVEHVTQQLVEGGNSQLPTVRPYFLSSSFLSKDEKVRSRTWDQLSRLRCVMIVDAVSLFHPDLRDALKDSEISSDEWVAMIVVSPINSREVRVNQLIDEHIGLELKRAFWRFATKLDKGCEVGVGDMLGLRRWLSVIIQGAMIASRDRRIEPGYQQALRKHLGQEPYGIEEAFL